jgi:hypothetical protein
MSWGRPRSPLFPAPQVLPADVLNAHCLRFGKPPQQAIVIIGTAAIHIAKRPAPPFLTSLSIWRGEDFADPRRPPER